MTAAPKFSNTEKAREAEREVAMRKQVYGKRSGAEGMSAAQRRQIEVMSEIAADYAKLAEGERLL